MAGQAVLKTVSQDVISETVQPLYIGGIDPLGSDSKLTIASNGNVSTATPLTVPSLTVNSKPVMSSLLAEYTVTGSAVTSIDFSGLDINTHKSYRVEFDFGGSSSAEFIYMYINNDTTLSNYQEQVLELNSSTVYSARNATPMLCYIDGYNLSSGFAFIQLANGWPMIKSFYNRSVGSGTMLAEAFITKTASISNITQLTFTASVASGFSVGSKIRIFRGDV